MGWLEDNIEEPVRDVVKHLRDNGFNTECSCGHEMYVQLGHSLDGELMRLHQLLFCYFAERKEEVSFEIHLRHKVMDQCPFTSVDVLLTGRHKDVDHLKKMHKYHLEQAKYLEDTIANEEEHAKARKNSPVQETEEPAC